MRHERRPCRRRPTPAVPLHVLGPADALAVLGAAASLIVPGRVAALVLDPDWRPLDLCLCADDDEVEERSRLLLDMYAGETAGVVFAHVRARTDAADAVTPREQWRYARVAAHGDDCGAVVLDWFVLVGDAAASIAELSGGPWRWLAPDLDAG